MKLCTFCGGEIDIDDKVFRKDECPHCRRDLHCCLQCQFYEPGRQNECREPRAENVAIKEKSNYCDYFEFAGGSGKFSAESAEDAKKKLKDLFKI